MAAAAEAIVHEHAFSWRAHLPHLRDPGRASLRRAIRAAILVPAMFALAAWIYPQPQFVTFATFGVFALLVMGDFGGTSRPRAGAYVTTSALGVVLISFGTLASGNAWAAAAVVLVGGFVVEFAGVFGGYVTAAQLPLLLSLVLSVAIPVTPEMLPQRIAGWILGGAVALLGGVWLWPRHEQMPLRAAAARASEAVAGLVMAQLAQHAPADELERARQRTTDAVAALRQLYLNTPFRPASPARQDRAFAELVDELSRAPKLVTTFGAMQRQPPDAAPRAEDLARATSETLRDSARVLEAEGAPAGPDGAALADRREQMGVVLEEWAARELRSGAAPERVLDGLESSRAARIVAFMAQAIGANATLAAGRELDGQPPPAQHEVEAGTGVRIGAQRALDSVRTHFQPSSIWLRNSLRAAVGLALAMLLVELIGLDHAFWAVLGTLSVLRSNALATGRTALAAIVGTTLGILPTALLLIPLGTNQTVLWILFPISVFLAAYAPSVIGFVVGQAAFTLLVVVLFNLIQPVGWTLGLVRLEDVLIGAGLSLVVGTLMWPRGARGQLNTAFGRLYRRNAAYLRAAFGVVIGRTSTEQCQAARDQVRRESERTAEVFDQFLHDRAAKVLPPATWAALQAGGSHLLLAGDSLEQMGTSGHLVNACAVGATALSEAAERLANELDRLGANLERGEAPSSSPGQADVADGLSDATVACLRDWGGADEPARHTSALAMVSASDWVRFLSMLLEHLSGPGAAAIRVSRQPWWH